MSKRYAITYHIEYCPIERTESYLYECKMCKYMIEINDDHVVCGYEG